MVNMERCSRALLVGLLSLLAATDSLASDAAVVVSDPALDPPTLHCLGVYWIVGGDGNRNATVHLEYRPSGASAWRQGPSLVRVEKGAHVSPQHGTTLSVPDDAWLFAGSILGLVPGLEYEIRISLTDPDGRPAERLLRARTATEPAAPSGMRRRHVVPGAGGGSGTAQDPFGGLAQAQQHARPGDLFLIHGGVYEGTFLVNVSGQPHRPIIWRAAGDGAVILDGQGSGAERPGRAISANDVHDVWFEGLTVRNADWGIVAHNASRLVIRRCHVYSVDYGIACTNNDSGNVEGFFITDNAIQGPSTWPRTKGIENARGIQVTGAGHVIAYNQVRGFADGIDTFPSQRCSAIDIHNNEISEMTDDGIETDYSERNVRVFGNRLTNVFQGISCQPVYGGPIYIIRNAMYNVGLEVFKLHNSPSGVLMMHNTAVKCGIPLVLWTSEPVRNCISRNNLFIGTEANFAYETTAPMEGCDFDHDGFGGGPWPMFLKWNGERYATAEDVRARAPVYRHVVVIPVEGLFAGGVLAPEAAEVQYDPSVNDLRLDAGSAAVDMGVLLAGINDDFGGAAPDLGAFELGSELPQYGPRWAQGASVG